MGDHWDSQFETMPWKDLRAYWLEKMTSLMDHVTANSEFYRDHLKGFPERLPSIFLPKCL